VEILAPPAVAPRGGEVLRAQLSGLLRPWWRRITTVSRTSVSSTPGPTPECASACGCPPRCPWAWFAPCGRSRVAAIPAVPAVSSGRPGPGEITVRLCELLQHGLTRHRDGSRQRVRRLPRLYGRIRWPGGQRTAARGARRREERPLNRAVRRARHTPAGQGHDSVRTSLNGAVRPRPSAVPAELNDRRVQGVFQPPKPTERACAPGSGSSRDRPAAPSAPTVPKHDERNTSSLRTPTRVPTHRHQGSTPSWFSRVAESAGQRSRSHR
jgi:hypothetical protein